MANASLISSRVAGREGWAVRSVIDPTGTGTGTGTRRERLVSFPSNSEMIRPTVLAAPEEVGIVDSAAARARRRPSLRRWSLVLV